MTLSGTTLALDLGVVAVIAAAFAVQRCLHRRWIRDQHCEEILRQAAYRRRQQAAAAPFRRMDPLDDITDEEECGADVLGEIIDAAFPADLPGRLAAEIESDRRA
jgi:hypothetical protein